MTEFSPDRLELLQRIAQLFMQYGVKSVTMDDLARQLGRSKKTIYQYFPNKEELVRETMSAFIQQNQAEVAQICSQEGNAIEEWIRISTHQFALIQHINSSIIFDIHKYYPKAWEVFNEHKVQFVYGCVRQNIERGIQQGLYRSDVVPEVIATYYIHKLEMFAVPDTFGRAEISRMDAFRQVMMYHLFGVASDKGRDFLKTMTNNPTHE
jgi:TetR/AcrR family transcriptional regulator, cholesterol catabolism regulator